HWPAVLASLTHDKAASPAPADATPSTAPAAAPTTAPSALPNPVTKTTVPAASDTAGAPAGNPSPATSGITVLPTPAAADTAAAKDATAATAPLAEAPLVLTFKGTSWAEVKDTKGRVVLQMTGGAGMTQTVSAMPPHPSLPPTTCP